MNAKLTLLLGVGLTVSAVANIILIIQYQQFQSYKAADIQNWDAIYEFAEGTKYRWICKQMDGTAQWLGAHMDNGTLTLHCQNDTYIIEKAPPEVPRPTRIIQN